MPHLLMLEKLIMDPDQSQNLINSNLQTKFCENMSTTFWVILLSNKNHKSVNITGFGRGNHYELLKH